MTSRQPETEPPETEPPGTAGPGTTGPGRDPQAAQLWLLRVLPVAALIILGLAGLRGAVAAPHWNGPLRRDGSVIGAVFEVLLIVLTVVTARRRSRGSQEPVARKLRAVLLFTEVVGIVAVAVITIVALHLHIFSLSPGRARPRPAPSGSLRSGKAPSGKPGHAPTIHISAAVLLYILLVVVLLAVIAVCVWYARRLRPAIRPSDDDFIVEDAQDLRDAVRQGRSALAAADDARAAIIACYVAMESRLADRGAARGAADTPDELLARARGTGIVRGSAPARLTALFYEARFSSHPLADSQRDAAAAALDELAAALADEAADETADAGTTAGGGAS